MEVSQDFMADKLSVYGGLVFKKYLYTYSVL